MVEDAELAGLAAGVRDASHRDHEQAHRGALAVERLAKQIGLEADGVALRGVVVGNVAGVRHRVEDGGETALWRPHLAADLRHREAAGGVRERLEDVKDAHR